MGILPSSLSGPSTSNNSDFVVYFIYVPLQNELENKKFELSLFYFSVLEPQKYTLYAFCLIFLSLIQLSLINYALCHGNKDDSD